MNTSKILLIFIVVGTALWALSGFIVNMACFVPVYMFGGMKPDQELARQAMGTWAVVGGNVVASWAGAGALMGFLTFLIFMFRPSHEHFTRVPMMNYRPPFAPAGPRTLAEGNAAITAAVIGGALSALMAVYLLPHFERPGILVAEGVKMRAILSGIQCLIATVLILPISLGIASRMIRRQDYE